MTNRETLLTRMNDALARMEADGAARDHCEHYAELKRKYDAIKAGADYTTKNVAPEMIAAYAAQIPRANFGMDGVLIKPRGNIRAVVEGASDFVKELTE